MEIKGIVQNYPKLQSENRSLKETLQVAQAKLKQLEQKSQRLVEIDLTKGKPVMRTKPNPASISHTLSKKQMLREMERLRQLEPLPPPPAKDSYEMSVIKNKVSSHTLRFVNTANNKATSTGSQKRSALDLIDSIDAHPTTKSTHSTPKKRSFEAFTARPFDQEKTFKRQKLPVSRAPAKTYARFSTSRT